MAILACTNPSLIANNRPGIDDRGKEGLLYNISRTKNKTLVASQSAHETYQDWSEGYQGQQIRYISDG